jgi:maltooligosyltrehalose trehalohydrolase
MPSSAVTSSTTGDSSITSRRAVRRRLPIGAEPIGDGRTHLRVWAPCASRVETVLASGGSCALDREEAGYFSGVVAAKAGERYRFRLDDDDRLYPDPASRFQPEGPHGPSEIIDPASFRWTDDEWRGVVLENQVFYELHVGTFTRLGTWAAAAGELGELARLGITIVEVMPVAEFDGRFGWGYDGVDLFAPTHLYGAPDDFRRFVDAAHGLGLGVVLDFVPNHFGPSGNYLRAFSPSYFTDKYGNEWGEAINFDGPDAAAVREFFTSCAAHWIGEYHLDGLRLDATQQVFDESEEHILAAIGRHARSAAGERSIVLVAENEPQDTKLARPLSAGGYGLDALWNDDFHHSAMVALTGRAEAYYSDTGGEPQEFVSAAKYGYLFQGQHYEWQQQSRGQPSWGLSPATFVIFLQNHDQVANSAHGLRGDRLTSPGRWRAMTALLLLGPGTPLLFQGQEFGASAPFLYFADFDKELSAAVREGRREFLSQFPSAKDAARRGLLDDPGALDTFERCRLDVRERETHAAIYALHGDLLRLRRSVAAFRQRETSVDGAVLSAFAFALRFFTAGHTDDRVLIVNLGRDLHRGSIAEPLLAPPAGCDWVVEWSSDDPRYGGAGVPDILPANRHWYVPGESAVLLAPGAPRPPIPSPTIRRRT